MGSAARITNYAATGIAQLTSSYSKPRGTLVILPPVLQAITPATGAQAGGDLVYLTGRAFDAAFSVTIGGSQATIISAGGGVIIAKTPTGTGTQDVVVFGPGGSSTIAGGFVYQASVPVPTVSAISPTIGFFDGGDTVTITGTNFVVGATTFAIGGVACTGVTVTSSTTATALTGAKTRSTGNTVTATTTGGTSPPGGTFEYFDPTSPPGASATCVTYFTARHCTQSGGFLTAMPDSKGTNTGVISGTPGYTASNASFNGRPSMDFPAGGTSQIKTTNAGGITTGARSVVAVATVGSAAGSACYVWSESTGADECYTNVGTYDVMTSNDGTNNVTAVPGSAGFRCLVACLDGTASARFYQTAQTAISGNAGALANLTGRTFGLGNYTATPLSIFCQQGSIFEWLAFTAALSDSDAKYIETRYGLICNQTIGS